MPTQFSGRNSSFFKNGVRTTGYPHAEGWSWTAPGHQTQKLIHNGSYQNIKAKTVKFLEANMGSNLQDFGVRQSLLWYVAKMTITKFKNDNLDFMEIKNFCVVKK